jgi:heavy metal sensor kinase
VGLPIQLRITLWHVALLGILIAAVGTFLVLRLRADLTDAIDHSLTPAAAQVAHDYGLEGIPEFSDASATVLHGERAASQLVDTDGRIMAAWGDPVSRKPLLRPAEVDAVIRRGRTLQLSRSGGGDATFRLVARPAAYQGLRQAIVAVESLRPVQTSVRRVGVLLVLAVPVALVATALSGWWLARRALAPVSHITATAAAIGPDRLGARVPLPAQRSRDEVARLAATFNTMLDRLEDAVREQRRLVADASHELRTPLAAMRAELDVSLRADEFTPAARLTLESSREEVVRMGRTIDDLLTLAAVDDGALTLVAEPVALERIVAATLDALKPWAAERDVALQLDAKEALVVADPRELGRAIRNLVANAIGFSPAGGVVQVSVSTDAATARVEVADQGPGVPPELRERIFDRFFRADPSRTRATGGSGLGLAITRHLSDALGGSVMVAEAASGARFVLSLPLAQVDDDAPRTGRRAVEAPRQH